MKKLPPAPRWLQIFVLFLLLLPFVPLFFSFAPFLTEDGYFRMAFEKLFERQELLESLIRSLKIAFASSLLSVIIASLAAWLVEKKKDRFVSATLLLSMGLPEIVLGLSLLMSFSIMSVPLSPLTVTLSHASFCYAYATIVLRSHAQNLDTRIFEAAKDLGATPFQRLLRVTAPLFSASLVAAFLLCMTLSLDDYLISAFTSGAGQDTLPMKIYGLLRYGFGPELKAVSLLLFSTSIIFVLIGLQFFLRSKKHKKLTNH